MANNPWNVHAVSMFLKYCCPECDYQISELDVFELHATSCHELSKILFENVDKFGEAKNGFQIKEEVYDPLEYNDYSESKFNNWEEQQLETNLKEEADEHLLKELHCNLCEYKTNQKRNFNNHLLKLHDIHSDPCHICDFKTHQPSKLAKHLLEEHGISKYSGHLACHLCPYKTDQSHNLNTHILKHHGEYSNPCHICDFKTHQSKILTEHLYKEHGISRFSGDFACHICDYKTYSRSNINVHVTKMHGEFSEYAYSCHCCDFKSNLKTELKKHALDIHNIPNYVCDPPKKSGGKHLCHLCDFQADLQRNLTNHLKHTHGEITSKSRGKEGSKCCHICDFRTKYTSGLKSHVANMHGEVELKNISIYSKAKRKYTKDENGFNVCPFPLCDYKSKGAAKLKRHFAKIHKDIELDTMAPKSKEDKNSKKCHLCNFSTKFTSNLKNHIVRSHGKSELNGTENFRFKQDVIFQIHLNSWMIFKFFPFCL